MRNKRRLPLVAVLAPLFLWLVPGHVPGRLPQEIDGNAALAKLDRNLNPESFEAYRKLVNTESGGRTKEFVLYTVKKGQTMLPPAEPMNRAQNRIQNWKGYSAIVFLILEIIYTLEDPGLAALEITLPHESGSSP